MSIAAFSTDAGSNASLGFAEGQAPSTLNDGIRGVLGHVRESYNDASWIDYRDGTPDGTYTRLSGTSFKVTGGSDVTAKYGGGVRVRAIGATTGTIYGTITNSSYSAPDTTVTVAWNSGSLANEALSICISVVEPNASPSGTPDFSTGSNGYYTLPGGLIIQWGSGPLSNIPNAVTFATTFPNGALSITATIKDNSPYHCTAVLTGLSSFSLYAWSDQGQNVIDLTATYNYIAIGY